MTKEKINQIIAESESLLSNDFAEIDKISLFNQEKVLNAFIKNRIALRHFNPTTGYGYGDEGRDSLGAVFADVFCSESAIVSSHILSGTHSITLGIFALVRHGDNFLSISGKPYDTLSKALCGDGNGSLADYGVKYNQVELLEDGSFDCETIVSKIKDLKPKIVFIQRSRGYTTRSPFSISKIESICKVIKSINKESIIFIDNCYGEFTEEKEPIEAGADIIAGSLIKNPGGGIAQNGGYLAGSEKLIEKVADRMTVPFLGREIGSNFGGYQYTYQGFFLAPHVTAQALKGALLMGEVMKGLGFPVFPSKKGECYDLIRAIEFKTEQQLINFCQAIQQVSPIDSYVTPYPWDMPGYKDQVIMAAGCFVQGSSIELSADAPIRAPYVAYCQGGLTYEHIKLAVRHCALKVTN